MELIINNYRGISSATIKLHENITLIGGKVGSGKTSTIQALQAAVTGEKVPVSDIKQKDALLLVHESLKGTNKTGSVTLKWNGGEFTVKWPSCKTSGDKFHCSKYAAGMAKPSRVPAKELTELLQILPTKEEFAAEMEENLPGQVPVDALWEKISRLGWDETHSQAAERGTEYKREWQKLTGQEFGSVQSAKWQPDNLTDDSLETLQTNLHAAELMYEHAVKTQALGEKEHDDLAKLAGKADDIRRAIAEKTNEQTDLSTELSKAQSMLKMIPDAVNPKQSYSCWHCGKLGMIEDGQFIEAPNPEAAEADANTARTRIAEQNKRIQALTEKRDALTQELFILQKELQESKDAEKKLGAMPPEPAAGISVNDARAELELCHTRIQAHNTYQQAVELRDTLTLNQVIVSVLSPNGLRKQVLSQKLGSFNELLASISTQGEWNRVELTESLDVRYGDIPYSLLSRGQQYICDATLQVALAKLDKSQLLILDKFDYLDPELQNGLFEVLCALPIPVVLGCRFSTRDAMPNFSDFGASYWCEETSLHPIVTQEMAVAQ